MCLRHVLRDFFMTFFMNFFTTPFMTPFATSYIGPSKQRLHGITHPRFVDLFVQATDIICGTRTLAFGVCTSPRSTPDGSSSSRLGDRSSIEKARSSSQAAKARSFKYYTRLHHQRARAKTTTCHVACNTSRPLRSWELQKTLLQKYPCLLLSAAR